MFVAVMIFTAHCQNDAGLCCNVHGWWDVFKVL